MTKGLCGVCRYFVPHDGDGTCRRYPPVPLAYNTVSVSAWPSVGERDWCGEFKLAPDTDRR